MGARVKCRHKMRLPVARAERVNNGKRTLNRMAESSGDTGAKGHRCSPSYTPAAARCKPLQEDPNTQPEDV